MKKRSPKFPEKWLKLYRVVNREFDPIVAGVQLTRCSDNSNQKHGDGIYFVISRADALAFARSDHKHTYTHVLTCRLKDISMEDFVDLRIDPNCIFEGGGQAGFKAQDASTNGAISGLL